MAPPVWVLAVNLETKTATFTSGLSDAAKSARGSFTDIKDGAREMGGSVGYSSMEARHGVMLLGEEFGVHLPRALTSFISSLGPVGAAMSAAFPFLAIIVGATLLLEHLSKLKAEGEKLTESQSQFGATVANVLNGLDDKLLTAGIRTDELNHNHLAALEKQLSLIDHQSMQELTKAFDVVAKAADVTFTQLKASWYQWGAGAAGAKQSLESFKTQYDSLLAQGKDTEANALLDAKIQREQHILDLQKQQKDNQTITGTHGNKQGDYSKYEAAVTELKKLGVGYTEKEVAAQETLVSALNAQVQVHEKVAALKKAEDANAQQTTGDQVSGDADKVARERAQAQRSEAEEAQKLWEESYRTAVSTLQESEQQKIGATEKGSAARLAAIDAAIREEQSKGLQETGFYRTLLKDRVDLVQQMSDEEKKIKAEAGKEEADSGLKIAELAIAAEREKSQLSMAARHASEQERVTSALQFAQQEYTIKAQAGAQEIAALDKTDKEYENKLRALQNKQLQLERAFQNEKAQIVEQAQAKQVSLVVDAEQKMEQAAAKTAASSIMQGKNMAQAFEQVGASMLQTMLTNLLQLETIDGKVRFESARTGAAKAFADAGNPILGAVEAAATFTAIMAFQKGGIVPGVGVGDTVPALLEPGEGVLSNKVMDRLNSASRSGSTDGGTQRTVNLHMHHAPVIHALDAQSMERVLRKNAEVLSRHLHGELRKMNR